MSIETPGTNCPNGGTKIDSGLDANANGVLDDAEISGTQYVCNGAPGAVGATGDTGAAGTNGLATLVFMTDEAPGANCISGGQQINIGPDVNLSGALDSTEITSSSYVCNGASGATGATGAPVRPVRMERMVRMARLAPMAIVASMGSTA